MGAGNWDKASHPTHRSSMISAFGNAKYTLVEMLNSSQLSLPHKTKAIMLLLLLSSANDLVVSGYKHQ